MHRLYFKLFSSTIVKLCQDSESIVIDISGLSALNGEIQEH